MKRQILLLTILGLGLVSTPLTHADFVAKTFVEQKPVKQVAVLSTRQFSLEYRYPVASVSRVFKDNILLNLAYLSGRVTKASEIDWATVTQSQNYQFSLRPGETFAFHDLVLPQFAGKVALTTNARFNKQDGFKSDGYLYGDGVCHLASIISWAAKDAGLTVLAPTNHNFAAIPEVPKSEGVSIYYDPNGMANSARQNLYVTNNRSEDVTFTITYQNGNLEVKVSA